MGPILDVTLGTCVLLPDWKWGNDGGKDLSFVVCASSRWARCLGPLRVATAAAMCSALHNVQHAAEGRTVHVACWIG